MTFTSLQIGNLQKPRAAQALRGDTWGLMHGDDCRNGFALKCESNQARPTRRGTFSQANRNLKHLQP